MPAAKLLSELKSLGVELWPQDGQLKFRAPQGLLNAERLAQLREHKEQILHLLETQERPLVQADPANHHAPFPLTDVQNAYLLGRQSSFGYGNVACHGYLELSWPRLDPQQVEQAWNRLIARHDMLRAVIDNVPAAITVKAAAKATAGAPAPASTVNNTIKRANEKLQGGRQ